MPRERYESMDEEKKARLLSAAAKEFAAHGYELASINTILDGAGLSKGSFYYYFEDKADLAATVMIEVSEPAVRAIVYRQPTTEAEFWSELRRVSVIQIRELESKRTNYEALMRLGNAIAKNPELAAKVMPAFGPRTVQLGKFFAAGVAVGALRSDLPLPMLMSIIQAMKNAAYAARFPVDTVPSDQDLEQFTDLVLDLAQRLCRPPKG
jgi:AcrR family transcriptional regulator